MLLTLALLAAVPAPLRFEVVTGELPNLVYQLDCVSGVIHACSREAFEPTWKTSLLQDDADRAALAQWAAVHARYGGRVEFPSVVPLPLGARAGVQLEGRLRLAGLLARSVDDFIARIDVLVHPNDRATLSAVVRRFEPRFRPVWQANAKGSKGFAAELTQALGDGAVSSLVSRFRTFYDAQVPDDRPLPFVIVDRPEQGSSKSTHGEQIDGVSLLEVLPGEHAKARLDVALHELCHFFFFSARPQTLAAFQTQVLGSKVAGATAGYRLFDEAVATALGNGLAARAVNRPDYEKRLARPLGFYNDPDIDRAAKAVMPFVEQWTLAGRSIGDEGFAEGYLGALATEYGAGLSAPRLAMFDLMLFRDEAIAGDVHAALEARFHLNQLSMVSGGIDEPDVRAWYVSHEATTLFLLQPAHVKGLVALGVLTEAEARALSSASRPVLFGKPRGAHERVVVLVASDLIAVSKGLDAVAAAKGPIEGRVDL
jgi:hypothetical protein